MDAQTISRLAARLHVAILAHAAVLSAVDSDMVTDMITEFADRFHDDAARTGSLRRRDDSWVAFDRIEYLISAVNDDDITDASQRIAAAGALITLGDALTAANYFDKSPELEFVRHLRNGIAHGNRFHLVGSEPRHLAQFTGATGTRFHITQQLNGTTVLFEFLGVGDVCDLLRYVSQYCCGLTNVRSPTSI